MAQSSCTSPRMPRAAARSPRSETVTALAFPLPSAASTSWSRRRSWAAAQSRRRRYRGAATPLSTAATSISCERVRSGEIDNDRAAFARRTAGDPTGQGLPTAYDGVSRGDVWGEHDNALFLGQHCGDNIVSIAAMDAVIAEQPEIALVDERHLLRRPQVCGTALRLPRPIRQHFAVRALRGTMALLAELRLCR